MRECTETRAGTICRVSERYLAETSASMVTFAIAVREEYHARVPLHLREVEFSAHADVYKAARLDAQQLRRMMDGEIRMPVDLEEAWIFALPERYRKPLLAELAARCGLLAAVMPQGNGGEGAVHAGQLAKEFGEAMQALAPMLANGVIDERDLPYAKHALQMLTELVAAATTMIADVTAILPEPARGKVSA